MSKSNLFKIINWMPGRGNPYLYQTHGSRDTYPPVSWKIAGELCNQKKGKAHRHAQNEALHGKPIRTLDLDLHLRTLSALKPEVVARLVAGVEPRGRRDGRASGIAFVSYLDGDGRPRKRFKRVGASRFKAIPPKAQTFRAFLDYPFQKGVIVTITPFKRRWRRDGTRSEQSVGHIVSHIARAYAEVYRTAWREVRVWGHGFNDLHLEGLEIYGGGWVAPLVGS